MIFLNSFLANLFAKFKQSSPSVAAFVALSLMCVSYFAQQGTALGVFAIPSWAITPLQVLSTLVIALNHPDVSKKK
jgi:hypothetical protein